MEIGVLRKASDGQAELDTVGNDPIEEPHLSEVSDKVPADAAVCEGTRITFYGAASNRRPIDKLAENIESQLSYISFREDTVSKNAIRFIFGEPFPVHELFQCTGAPLRGLPRTCASGRGDDETRDDNITAAPSAAKFDEGVRNGVRQGQTRR